MRPNSTIPTPPKPPNTKRVGDYKKQEQINICNTCKFDIKDCEPARMTREINNTPFNSCTKCQFHEPKIITGSMWGYKRMIFIFDWCICLTITFIIMYSIYKYMLICD